MSLVVWSRIICGILVPWGVPSVLTSNDGTDLSIMGSVASIIHLPSVLMSQAGRLADAAVVTVPILKLWLTYWCWLYYAVSDKVLM